MKALLFLLLSFSYGSLNAQTIEGHVISSENIPIANCDIHTNFSKDGYATDQNGNFKFNLTKMALPADSVTITCIGYKHKKLPLQEFILNAPLFIQLEKEYLDVPAVTVLSKDKKQKFKKDNKGVDINLINFPIMYFTIQKYANKYAINFSIDTAEIVKEIGVYTGEWEDTSQVVYLLITKKLPGQKLPDTSMIILKKSVKINRQKGWSFYEINDLILSKGDYYLIADFSSLNFSDNKGEGYSIRLGTDKLDDNINGYYYSNTPPEGFKAGAFKWRYTWRDMNTIPFYNNPRKIKKEKPIYSYPALKIKLLKPVI